MGMLTNEELKKLEEVLTNIESQYGEDIDVCAKLVDYDDNIIDVEVEFDDGSVDIINLDRETFEEI
jgi:vacuolar-type H+-ATPase subunit E/Vma4